jgi:hypothetical protein
MLGKSSALTSPKLRLPLALLVFATVSHCATNPSPVTPPPVTAPAPVASAASVPVPAAPAVVPAPEPQATSPEVAEAPAAAEPEAVPTPEPTPAPVAPPAPVAAVPALLARNADGLSPKVLARALDAVACARARGVSGKTDVLTVIDYSLPSTQPRLWVLDLAQGKVLFHELVAHGAGSGDVYATHFSNVDNSRATSLGLFLTADTYEGGNGYSLKLKGLDEGFNDLAEARHIVMHGAWYVSAEHARQYGRLGRSWGCPALPLEKAHSVIDRVKGGSFVYAYSAADAGWLHASSSQTCPATPGGGTTPSQTALASAR